MPTTPATIWHQNGTSDAIPDIELRQAGLAMLEARRAMRGTLPGHLIHDVALEMLLTAYLVGQIGIAVTDLLDTLTEPVEIASRWLRAVESAKLVRIKEKKAMLTDTGYDAMRKMLAKVVHSQRELNGWSEH